MRILKSNFFFAVFMFGLLLWFAGYRFGTGDHPEYLPYVLYLHDHALYLNDFFVQGLQEKALNERTLLSYALLPFVNNLELACFILQAVFTVILIVGLQKIGEQLTGNITITRLAILVNFTVFFNHGLGDVELYADALQSSNISCAFIVFGLYYFFKQRYVMCAVLMSIASVIHPVEGLTVYMGMAAAMFVFTFIHRSCSWQVFFKSIIIYACTAGVWIAILLAGKIDGVNAFSSQFDHETFYRIYHEFRHAHHYVFQYMPLADKLLFVVFASINIVWGISSNKRFLWFNLMAIAGLITYIVCTDYLHIVDIANLQFYKVTPWMKFFALLIILKYAYELLIGFTYTGLGRKIQWSLGLAVVAVFIALAVIKPAWITRQNVYHQFTPAWKEKDDMVEISLQIDRQIDKNAVFIQPFSCSELKYFGRISSWVDFKAFLKNRSRIFEWYRRIQMIYGISIDDKEKGFELRTKADNYFFNLNAESVARLKHEGVTHILTPNKNWAFGKLVLSNKSYAVYQL